MSHPCPQCALPSRVVDSRERPGGITYRRRVCEGNHRWSTYEIPEVEYNRVKQALTIIQSFQSRLATVLKDFPSLTHGD